MARLWLTLAWAAMACAACTRPAKEGVIVRQVLHGTDVLKDTVPDAAPIPGQPSRAQQPGQVTTTLVTDTPQAAYKRALDGVRKQLETDSARAALSRLESQIEQEQESPP